MFQILEKSFSPGFHPELHLGQINATKSKKTCCWNNKELERELDASNKALSLVQSNHCEGASEVEIKGLCRNVSGRLRYFKRISSGFWGWLRAIFRSKKTNQQLKCLATSLSLIQ